MKHGNRLISIVLLLIVLLYIAKLILQTDIGIEGQAYTELKSQIAKEDAENSDIQKRLYTLESFKQIGQEARKLGFIEITQYYYIKGGDTNGR